jgi:hypothetical protein
VTILIFKLGLGGIMENLNQLNMREVHLHTPVTEEDNRALEIGDVVYLSGLIFTVV